MAEDTEQRKSFSARPSNVSAQTPFVREVLGKRYRATVLDGNAQAQNIVEELRLRVAKLAVPPVLLAVLVGDDPASEIFLKEKNRQARRIGIEFRIKRFPGSIASSELSLRLHELFRETRVDAILIQLPLPGALDRSRHSILRLIPEKKDADCLSERWLGRMQSGRLTLTFKNGNAFLLPPVAGAVKELLAMAHVSLPGTHAVVLGWGDLVGKPVAAWLLHEGATVTVVQESQNEKEEIIRTADVVVCGTGRPGLVKKGMVKKNAVVLDAGYTMEQGKVSGDVVFDEVADEVAYISPVPGGVGPLTVAQLLRNVVSLAEARRGVQ